MKHLYILALLLGFSLSNVMAQKIEVGSCTLKDGGIYTGELKWQAEWQGSRTI